MASVGGEQQISSNSPAAEITQRADSREGSVERKAAAHRYEAHSLASANAFPSSALASSNSLHCFAQVGGADDYSDGNGNSNRDGNVDCIEADLQAIKDRDEKLKLARERQNEEKQRKIEELRAQAEAAQRYREQTEEKRRRRIEELRLRDSEKRHQVEERKRAIMEADKERREYILKKNQERDGKMEAKRRERSSTGFAFGSSTPRNLELYDYGVVSTSTFLGQRRSTSISNVAGASLSRRSSERELTDSGSKKRATSASGTDRHDDRRYKSTSMYEVFNWGYSNDEPPKRFSLSIMSSEINIGEPTTATSALRNNSHHHNNNNNSNNNNNNNITYNTNTTPTHRSYANHLTTTTTTATTTGSSNVAAAATAAAAVNKEDHIDAAQFVFRSVARRKTDLMPTIPSPRDGHYGSKSSLSNTPRTPGRAYSMNRLDQLAQPIRRNGEHIRAILERERREQMELLDETASLGGGSVRRAGGNYHSKKANSVDGNRSVTDTMSRSMTHLAGGNSLVAHNQTRGKYSLGGGISSSFRPLGSVGNRDACKSMSQLTNTRPSSVGTQPSRSTLGLQTAATKKYLQSSLDSSSTSSYATKRGGANNSTTNPYRFDPNSLLLMNSSSVLVTAGSRSGNVTPGGSMNPSRPGSAMSTSTNLSTSGFVARRSVPAARKPRPASIAGTGVSLDEINKLKKDKPPMKSATPSLTSAQTTPKRPSNVMSTSMIVTSSSSRLSSAEKKTPSKRETSNSKSSTPKSLSKTSSFDRLNKLSKDNNKPKENNSLSMMTKSAIVASTPTSAKTKTVETTETIVSKIINVSTDDEKTINDAVTAASPAPISVQSKEEKNALNSIKTEEINVLQQPQKESEVVTTTESVEKIATVKVSEEKVDQGNEKTEIIQQEIETKVTSNGSNNNNNNNNNNSINKENSEMRELTPPTTAQNQSQTEDLMSTSMIAKNKITTEEEAKAALAERRRLAREEAERQAELERQRLEAERLAELKRQEEEAERQRQFEEEAMRLAQEQRKAEEERLRQAIEEAKQREEEERRKREEEERQRLEREEAEKKAKEEAEKQRIEVAERLKREEKEREERRKRVETIMARTRRAGAAANAANVTPTKENETNKTANANETPNQQQNEAPDPTTAAIVAPNNIPAPMPVAPSVAQDEQQQQQLISISSESSSGSSSTTATTPTPNPTQAPLTTEEPQNSQAMYEQSVIDKENELINSFSNMIIDENAKNRQQIQHLQMHQQQQQLQLQQQQQQQQQTPQIIDAFNGKMHTELPNSDSILQNSTQITTTTTTTVANGNGHIENINNKNDINLLQDIMTPATNQLIDLSIESQGINDAVNFNNNNSLLTTTTTPTTLVTADSHENKDISLL